MKKILIILILVALLSGGYIYYKKYKNTAALRVDFDHFKPLDSGWGLKLLTGGFNAELGFKINNFSDSTYSVNQIMITAQTIGGTVIAQPTKPMTEKFVIEPNSQPVLNIPYYFDKAGIADLIKNSPIDLATMLGNYLATGKLGVKIHLTGYMLAEGIANIPFDETIEI